MFDWGFDNFVLRDILSSSDLVQEVPVALSSEASYVSTHAAEDISCLLPDNVEPDSARAYRNAHERHWSTRPFPRATCSAS